MAYNVVAHVSCNSFRAVIPKDDLQIAVEHVDSARELLEDESPNFRARQLR